MPSITLSFMENKAKQAIPELPRSAYKKLGKIAFKRFEKFTTEPTEQEVLELFKTIVYGDPTGDTAVRHLTNPAECEHHASVARRLAAA
ncbi:hypothetical protein [Glutamicibacter sp. MCAF14]|uniref:hypothetical protein n=1 Tax=Glutamicibacter sp. MCAF14 TaxID=3233043 RepID=UPI003F8E08C0